MRNVATVACPLRIRLLSFLDEFAVHPDNFCKRFAPDPCLLQCRVSAGVFVQVPLHFSGPRPVPS